MYVQIGRFFPFLIERPWTSCFSIWLSRTYDGCSLYHATFYSESLFTHPDGKTGALFCKLLTGGNFTWIGGAASVFTLVAIAFERYYAVMYPYGNKGKLTYNKLMVSETECI